MQERATTYTKAEKGPLPAPEWLVTAQDATDVPVADLKAGKEAKVKLFSRSSVSEGRSVLLAAKQLFDINLRDFRKDHDYRAGRRKAQKRDTRALQSRSRYGKEVKAFEWARHEFDVASTLWDAGVPVPYPVSFDRAEFVMEFIGDHDDLLAAPRLIDIASQLDAAEFQEIWEQLSEAIFQMAEVGVVHADLSPYNVLLWGDIKIIDFPQSVDPNMNPTALTLLERDITTVATWFEKRGTKVNPTALLARCTNFFAEED